MSSDGVSTSVPIAEFVWEGDYWMVSFEERVLRVRDSKGMGYLAELLAHPDREIEALTLSAGRSAAPATPGEAAEAGLAYASDSGAGPLLDEPAKRAYRERLGDLRGEIDEADAFHDPERAAQARAEYEAIVEELAAASGLGGRDRREGSPAERARLNVTRSIRSAIARVDKHDEELGEHLSAGVLTGRVCVYRPDPAAPVAWTVSTRASRGQRRRRPRAPDTLYARKGEISIAYQVLGDGPIDVVLVNGLAAHMDLWWAEPGGAAALRQLASFARLILFDKPGTGLSDPVAGAPSLEQRVGDIRTVMDAVGSERAALIGYSEGGLASALFAATYPERIEALILLNTGAKTQLGRESETDALDLEHFWWVLDEIAAKRWGKGEFILETAPSWAQSEVYRQTAGIAERACASPGMVRAMIDALREYNVRAILPTISVPTLVIHARDDTLVPIEGGRDLARRIPGARLVETSGGDHTFFAGEWRPVVSEIEAFLTGDLPEPETRRALRTVLFLDVSGSIEGQPVDQVVQGALGRFDGHLIANHRRDGFLVAFDGASRAVRCAQAISAELRDAGLEIKAGIHSGGCEVIGDDLAGSVVQIGIRIGALANPSEVLVSRTVHDLAAGSGIEFSEREDCDLDGVPGRLPLYAAVADQHRDARPVHRVDGRRAELTPGPRDTMGPIDRAAVALAKRAPGISRLGFRFRRTKSSG